MPLQMDELKLPIGEASFIGMPIGDVATPIQLIDMPINLPMSDLKH